MKNGFTTETLSSQSLKFTAKDTVQSLTQIKGYQAETLGVRRKVALRGSPAPVTVYVDTSVVVRVLLREPNPLRDVGAMEQGVQ